jgi:lysyl-tRNA synthetase class 2
MASIDELRATRLAKIDLLKKASMEAYPAKVPRDHCLKDAKAHFAEYEKSQKVINLAGRIMAIRGAGAISFVVLDDGKATFQAVIKKDILKPDLFELFTNAVDIGDIISVSGTCFTTQRGEQSILVTSWTMASKSLLPLPKRLADRRLQYVEKYGEISQKKDRHMVQDKLTKELFSNEKVEEEKKVTEVFFSKQ